MKNRFFKRSNKLNGKIKSYSTFVGKDELNERQSIELLRRFRELQIRKVHLERELGSITSCLLSLSEKIKADTDHRRLSNLNSLK